MTTAISKLDLFAIKVVVREGKRMALNHEEMIVAAKLMQIKGYGGQEVADILGITLDLVHKYWRMASPVPLDKIPAAVLGPPIPKPPWITRDFVRGYTQMS